MSLTLLCMLLSGFLCLTNGGNPLQTDVRTKVELLKSLIYDKTKATVTLNSSALKQLVHLSSGNCNIQVIVNDGFKSLQTFY